MAHISRPKYRVTIPWGNEGEIMIWDNTSVANRAMGGSNEGRYPGDMRCTTVKDMSSTRYGLVGEGANWRVGMPYSH